MADYYDLERRVSIIENKVDELASRLSKSIKGGRANAEKSELSAAVIRYLRECKHVTAEYLVGQSTDEAFGEFMCWARANNIDYPRDKGSKTIFSNTVREVTGVGYRNAYFRDDDAE